MRELKILVIVAVVIGVIYWGVEPLAHSIMHLSKQIKQILSKSSKILLIWNLKSRLHKKQATNR